MLKSRLIYLGIILVSFIFSQALYESVSFMTFVIVLILPVISIVVALSVYPLISAKILVTSQTVYRLDEFVIRVLLKGLSPFVSTSIKVTCFIPDEQGREVKKTIFAVNPSTFIKSYFDYTCKLVNRGTYDIRISSIEYCDFLRLIRIKKRVKSKLTLNVIPRKLQLDIPVSPEVNDQENTYILGDHTVISGGDMVGVRDYVMGDNLKNVHWKLSSKSDELVTKQFADDICDRAFIIVDMCQYTEDEFLNKSLTDCVVETSLRAVEAYSNNAARFGIIIGESKTSAKRFSVTSPTDRIIADMEISRAGVVKNSDITDFLNSLDFNILSGAEVLVVTSFGSLEMLKNIRKLFINRKVKLKVINIVENEVTDDPDVIVFTKDYLENQVRGIK